MFMGRGRGKRGNRQNGEKNGEERPSVINELYYSGWKVYSIKWNA
jgi:hypothetical protein